MYDELRRPEEILFDGHPAVFGSVGRLLLAIVTLGLAAIAFWLRSKTTHYLITSQRITVERGLLSRTIDTLELYAVDDIELQKPIGQRLMGTGNIVLFTQDRTNPQLWLERLPLDVRALYERLRPAIEQAKYFQRIRSREG